MSITDIDEILKILSTKLNKIFYDREFVCCVHEDLQVILKNRNKCCVVVFPLLGPNYLKAVRYQAKIFDLAVFLLGSDKTCLIAVCHREHLIKKSAESEEQIMPESEQESGGSKLRKKRPERQLYVPPAQRRLPVNELPCQHNSKFEEENSVKTKRYTSAGRKKDLTKLMKSRSETTNCEHKNSTNESAKYSEEPKSELRQQLYDTVSWNNNIHLWWKYDLFDNTSVSNFRHISFRHFLEEFTIFSCEQKFEMSLLEKDYFLWQPALNVVYNENISAKFKLIDFYQFLMTSECNDIERRTPLLGLDILNMKLHYEEIMSTFDVFCDYDVLWIKDGFSKCAFKLFDGVYYLEKNPCECIEDQLQNYCMIRKEGNEMSTESQYKTDGLRDPVSTELNDKAITEDRIPETNSESKIPKPLEIKGDQETTRNEIIKHPGITNSENKNTSVSLDKNDSTLQKNNLKNSANLTKSNDYLKNTIKVNENMKLKSNHEEEKEIMRKAKENINRKSRPIIKYIDDTNNTLKIDRNDNVNNWEDLFDEDGQLEEDLLKEIVHKVGNEVTIVKAKEDYTEYVCKQIEELEHMVELYDFPSNLETHDIIQAFNDINSDAMYVKWVDDTHAILVLGSLSQAQKAINLSNPIIKVRPMTAASRVSLATAYQNDLRPAMKRPPTNLQTARRLITSHLGQKSGISKERSARERDDLKAAREMKKLVKQNEQDAWEGNLRSSIK
ncbi:hypothetical protein JTB14_025555 [Gonioctena quinquepunctata]|nr:hypothetical protein JTB14_025555 [Gonioctena quinquepunctata]